MRELVLNTNYFYKFSYFTSNELWYIIAIGFTCFCAQSNTFFYLCKDPSRNACTSSSTFDVAVVEPPPAKKSKTLMDFAYSETSWPQF